MESQQLTLGGLIGALGTIPQDAAVMVAGFGGGAAPGALVRHRPFADGLTIAVRFPRTGDRLAVSEMVDWLNSSGPGATVQHRQDDGFVDPFPSSLDTPMWVGMQHELTFYAVTGVEMVKGFAVIRTTNLAPAQGPSIQRISDEEATNRMRIEHLRRTGEDTVFTTHVERQLLRMVAGSRTRTLLDLEEARHDLTSFEASLQTKKDRVAKLEQDAIRNDYLLGIRDDLPGCNGVCHRASDVGVSVPGDPVAYPHDSCPEHGSSSR